MMTDAQIEAVAREYCRLRGSDPDLLVPYTQVSPGGLVPDVDLHVPIWKIVAERVRDTAIMREALKVAGIGICPECGWDLPTHAPQCPRATTLIRT